MASKPSVVIAGAGGLAFSLVRALIRAGYPVRAVISRDTEKASLKLGIPDLVVLPYSTRGLEADVLILAVPDGKIQETAREVCARNSIGCVVHCSGSADMNTLEGLGLPYGVVYPLQTFTPGRSVEWDQVPVFWESSEPGWESVIQQIAADLSGRAISLSSEKRALLHTGAVFANNFNNYLAYIASRFAEKAGQSGDIYQPILEETLAKLRVISPENAQTGPARRGDQETIRKHMELLHTQFPEYETLYRVFSDLIGKKEAGGGKG